MYLDRLLRPRDLISLQKTYSKNLPFPHLVLDDLFEFGDLKRLEAAFPSPQEGQWWKYENILEKKLARNDLHHFPLNLKWIIYELQSQAFVSFLEAMTGIEGLIVDHELNGGGLHQITQGGKLDIHADYNYHPTTKLDRRLNVLLYLNSHWKEEWKGNLEFWNADMTKCVTSIEPHLGRMVIFNVTDLSYHGHPEPLECPPDASRKSIALYYYTNGRPECEKSDPHSTIFKRRPQDPIIEEHESFRKRRSIKRI